MSLVEMMKSRYRASEKHRLEPNSTSTSCQKKKRRKRALIFTLCCYSKYPYAEQKGKKNLIFTLTHSLTLPVLPLAAVELLLWGYWCHRHCIFFISWFHLLLSLSLYSSLFFNFCHPLGPTFSLTRQPVFILTPAWCQGHVPVTQALAGCAKARKTLSDRASCRLQNVRVTLFIKATWSVGGERGSLKTAEWVQMVRVTLGCRRHLEMSFFTPGIWWSVFVDPLGNRGNHCVITATSVNQYNNQSQ